MVDVGAKDETPREAVACGKVKMSPETFRMVREGSVKKGDAIGVARIAGIMAAKRVDSIIPLCHPLAISSVAIDFRFMDDGRSVGIEARVGCTGKTGVEMEALTAASVALLTVYDMVKAMDRGMVLEGIHLLSKEGGRSGRWDWDEATT